METAESDSRTDADSSSAADAATTWSPPRCPRCDAPVRTVTALGPTDHYAHPCGCRVYAGFLE
ncbi:hypothetical protein [Natronorubrum halophilum]|uniref:hypothetical protein n=1 Tax=Natronorubrum halophilum TaxID=1702106 RepID=UPI001EE88F00|nr:hypothetical protein [Natronorubrum halophilum]